MSNSNMTALVPELWAEHWSTLDIGEYNLQNLVDRKYESTVANSGDVVNVPITPDGDAVDWTPGSSITASDIAQEVEQISLNISKRKTVTLTSADMSLTPYNLIEKYSPTLLKPLLKAANEEIYKEAIKSTYFTNEGVDAITMADINKANATLSKNGVSTEGRILVVAPDEAEDLRNISAFTGANTAGDAGKGMSTGNLGSKLGFNIFENLGMNKYTPTDVAGAVNLGAGYSIGDSSIVCDALNDDTNPVRSGDVFHFGSESEYYSVVSTTTTTSDTTGIVLGYEGSGLTADVADDAVINFVASRSALAFAPNAIAFVARPYAPLPEGMGVKSTIVDYQGLPIRLSFYHDSNLGIILQADLLCGVKLIDEKRIVRILAS